MQRQFVIFFTLIIMTIASFAVKAETFSNDQKTAIEQIVREYLVGNPEVLVEASQALQKKQQADMQQQAQAAIIAHADAIFESKTSPIIGNPDGKITLVEFFDYQCVHCKRMSPVIEKLVTDNKDLRIVFKEFPIFGQSSEFAAKAALAANMQNKYLPFHEVLMENKTQLTEKQVMKLAKSAGLNTKQLEKDMQSDAVRNELESNIKLAQALRLVGTPAFIVSQRPFNKDKKYFFVPGAAKVDLLEELIAKAAA